MGVQRSSFYNWKNTMQNPSARTRTLLQCVSLFTEYHNRYPSHDCRWLNAKLRLDRGLELNDAYAQKCCRSLGIRSRVKHYRYRKSGEPGKAGKVFPNLLLSDMAVSGPGVCLVLNRISFPLNDADMTAELVTDLWNYELLSCTVSETGPDSDTVPGQLQGCSLLLTGDHCALYSAIGLRELIPMYGIPQAAGLTGPAEGTVSMDAINSTLRSELTEDLSPEAACEGGSCSSPEQFAEDFRDFFNNGRPMYALGYLTPAEYRLQHLDGLKFSGEACPADPDAPATT